MGKLSQQFDKLNTGAQVLIISAGVFGVVGVLGMVGSAAVANSSKSSPEPVKETKVVEETIPIKFATEDVDTASLAKGETKVVTEGVDGTAKVSNRIYYENGKEVSRERLSDVTINPVTNRVVHHGTYVAPPPPSPPQYDDVYYVNCSEARADGVTPIYEGEAGYRPALDRDDDGIACE